MRESRVSLEAVELTPDEMSWTEAGAFIDRIGEEDPELAEQVLLMTPEEMRELYERLKLYYDQGIWSFNTVRDDGSDSGGLAKR